MEVTILLSHRAGEHRTALRRVLQRERWLDVIGEADSGTEAVRLAHKLDPDVMVVDLGLPDVRALEVTRIEAPAGRPRVVALGDDCTEDQAMAAVRLRATGYLLARRAELELLDAVAAAVAGTPFIGSGLPGGRGMDDRSADEDGPRANPLHRLTDAELEVFLLVSQGLSNAEIAERLYLQNGELEACLVSAQRKLGARSRVDLYVATVRCAALIPDALWRRTVRPDFPWRMEVRC